MGLGVGAVVGLIGGPAERALACSCAETTLAEFVGRHPEAIVAAFTGTQTDRAVEDEQAEDGAVLTFAVEAVFIGDVGATHEVRTHAQSSATRDARSSRPKRRSRESRSILTTLNGVAASAPEDASPELPLLLKASTKRSRGMVAARSIGSQLRA